MKRTRLNSRKFKVILRALLPTALILFVTEWVSDQNDWNWWLVLVVTLVFVLTGDLLIMGWLYRRQNIKYQKK